MRKIIGYLSEEDRLRWLRAYTVSQLVAAGNPNITEERAVEIVEDCEALFRELRERHEIAPEEVVDFPLYDGAIFEADE